MKPRQWAIKVVKTLQDAGFEALFAGGCVRDSLLQTEPKDFDVATSATPDEVQHVFGNRKTLAIGKSFGVITVLGPSSKLNIEVATFRRDGDYSDGRRPDSVAFTDAREDALRRDFTINGMFFDPIANEVIDYVEGQADLKRKLIRAIGVPQQRIEEDRLRMLRAIRFAATYGFEIEAETFSAIQHHAADIDSVSPERIGAELRKMLDHPNRGIAFSLLIESGLWKQILPSDLATEADWQKPIQPLQKLDADFATALALILRNRSGGAAMLQTHWRLTNEEVARTDWILKHADSLTAANKLPWSQLQPLLISDHAESAVRFLRAVSATQDDSDSLADSITLCEQKLALAADALNPAPLLRGDDLKAMEIEPGPEFKSILAEVRNRQLDGELIDSEAAKRWIVSQRGETD